MKTSTKDKVAGKLHEVSGKVKEVVGKALDNHEMQIKGKAERYLKRMGLPIDRLELIHDQRHYHLACNVTAAIGKVSPDRMSSK